MDRYAIAIQDLHKSFGKTVALGGLNFEFRAGVMHGLIGPEGAGKTTLLRCLVKLLKPNSGEITFFRDDQRIDFATVRPLIAYMPQQQSLYADLSIDEHLQFFRAMFQLPADVFAKRREDLLEITRLKQFVDRAAGKLSGGMYKKLGLMCALLRSPKILLLDEPTNGVDPISRREFWELLYALQAEDILIVVATAYMDEAERCGEIHLLEHGVRVAEGEPKELLREWQVPTINDLFLRERS